MQQCSHDFFLSPNGVGGRGYVDAMMAFRRDRELLVQLIVVDAVVLLLVSSHS